LHQQTGAIPVGSTCHKALRPGFGSNLRADATALGQALAVRGAPETRYTKSGHVHVAYQVLGNGPPDLVFVHGAASNLDSAWEEPSVAAFFRHLASFSRLICFDKRGTGLSDRVDRVPTLEDRMDDVRVVMDAVGSDTAALVGVSEGGAIAALFAATYPDRASAVIVIGSGATGWQPEAERQRVIDAYIEQSWGTGLSVGTMAPSVANDERIVEWFARWERQSASPSAVVALLRMNAEFDIRSILPTISSPTLVLHRTGDLIYTLEQGRFLAEHIPGARLVELPGTDHMPFFEDTPTTLGLIEEFITGTRRPAEVDRLLATTMFTDIVRSTETASEMGDRRWRETLDQYDAFVSAELTRYRGRFIKTTGDGTLAIFDGPARAIRCTLAIADAARRLDLSIRSGLHTGEVELRGDDIAGLAVVIAQRVSALAEGDELLVSSTVKDLVVGSGIAFTERGEETLKGVPGTWRLFAVST
jgi:pimeloyl-ACP methyl ester carboxylesterase/class 3 adenylate cyclase